MLDTADPAAEAPQSLRLLVKGFTGFDMRLLDGVVKLSQRRNPSLELVDDQAPSSIDVIIIDGKNEEAAAWAQEQSYWLVQQAVVWVDAQGPLPKGHTGLQRPVRWTDLPVILSRAMDDAIHYHAGESAEPSAAAVPVSKAAAQAQASQINSSAQTTASSEAVLGNAATAPAILVVDDSLAVRGHLTSELKAVGYAVSSVDSGEAAIVAVGSRPYDCILMDVLMPGMDGYEACRKIKAMPAIGGKAKPSIVMLTSKSSPFDRIRGKMAGCDAYLTKPVQKSHLMQVLAKYAFKNMTPHT